MKEIVGVSSWRKVESALMWAPDPDLEQHLGRLITRAFEEEAVKEQQTQKTADAEFARRGIYISGLNLRARRERAASAFKAAGERSIAEAQVALVEIFGTLQTDVISWFRAHMKQRFASHAIARTSALATDRLRTQMSRPDNGGVARAMNQVRAGLDRELEIVLVPLELRARLGSMIRGDLPSKKSGARDVDAFISHAGEDKANVARPLADGLLAAGLTVWLDQYELQVGSSVYTMIDEGLRRCRFGVVVLSKHFFAKHWPRQELAALAALSDVEGQNKILPVWHGLTKSDVAGFSPLLANVYAANTDAGLEAVIRQVSAVLRGLPS